MPLYGDVCLQDINSLNFTTTAFENNGILLTSLRMLWQILRLIHGLYPHVNPQICHLQKKGTDSPPEIKKVAAPIINKKELALVLAPTECLGALWAPYFNNIFYLCYFLFYTSRIFPKTGQLGHPKSHF